MLNFEQFKKLLPKKLQCKKISTTEELTGYKSTTFYALDEKNQIYTISRDKNGNLHILERDYEQEKKAKYDALKNIGQDMTLSCDPMLCASKRDVINTITPISTKEIILTPSQDKKKKDYTSIAIKQGTKTYSIVNNNGDVKLLEDEDVLQTDSNDKTGIISILNNPFEISLIDRIKMNNLPVDNGMGRVNHIASTFPQPAFVAITPKRMREWDEAEK